MWTATNSGLRLPRVAPRLAAPTHPPGLPGPSRRYRAENLVQHIPEPSLGSPEVEARKSFEAWAERGTGLHRHTGPLEQKASRIRRGSGLPHVEPRQISSQWQWTADNRTALERLDDRGTVARELRPQAGQPLATVLPRRDGRIDAKQARAIPQVPRQAAIHLVQPTAAEMAHCAPKAADVEALAGGCEDQAPVAKPVHSPGRMVLDGQVHKILIYLIAKYNRALETGKLRKNIKRPQIKDMTSWIMRLAKHNKAHRHIDVLAPDTCTQVRRIPQITNRDRHQPSPQMIYRITNRSIRRSVRQYAIAHISVCQDSTAKRLHDLAAKLHPVDGR